jgi:hypothetical protein
MRQFTSFRFVWYKLQLLCNGITACFCLLLFFPFCLFSQAPTIQWDKTIGGSSDDYLFSLRQTSDGGYILGGYSSSPISGDKSENSKGANDYWVVKLDANGNKLWSKTIGGSNEEQLFSIYQTSDGGYILSGYSFSPISGDKSENSKGANDYWVVKLDANGNRLWDKTIGGSGSDFSYSSLYQTSDGGYILGGYSDSPISWDKSENSKGYNDYWVVKLDANGNKVWDKTFGGSSDDFLRSLHQTSDGGYILGGSSTSPISGDKSGASQGVRDYWIVKLDDDGNKLWDKTFGGNSWNELTALHQTSDGGYILGGYSSSPISGDKSENSKGGDDYWVLKLDANGNKEWDKTIGGNSSDDLTSLHQTSDGGYILGGHSFSLISGDKSENSEGNRDYWVVKLDANGSKKWDKTIGGSGVDYLTSLHQTSDGGYILGGISPSSISGDKSENNKGSNDYWVVKLNPENTPTLTVNCTPYLNLCYKASQTYTVPPLEISGDLGIERISYTVYRYPLVYGPCQDNPGVYCPLSLRSGEGVEASGTFPQQVNSDIPQTSYEIWWEVLDANGEWHYCQTRVTIYPEITVSIPDVYAINPGGNINTVYIGYQPASSITLTATQSGANAPFSYNWSTVPSQSTQQITISPTVAGTYNYNVTITDASGCTAEFTKTITAINISSGQNLDKVYICHRDLKGKWTTLSVLKGSVANHLAHGDYLGKCLATTSTEQSNVTAGRTSTTTGEVALMKEMKLYPNPAGNYLDVQWTTILPGASSISITDLQGRVLKKFNTGVRQPHAINKQRISLQSLARGTYILTLTNGSEKQVSKFVVQ